MLAPLRPLTEWESESESARSVAQGKIAGGLRGRSPDPWTPGRPRKGWGLGREHER
jgi:hypothetical protein